MPYKNRAVRNEHKRVWLQLRKYSITKEQWEELAAKQEGKCAICLRYLPLRVDHNHATGKVRGLLCHSCNLGIGIFEDDPDRLQRASEYVRIN